eukprot:538390-Prorocentrum_minimum.AAC.1
MNGSKPRRVSLVEQASSNWAATAAKVKRRDSLESYDEQGSDLSEWVLTPSPPCSLPSPKQSPRAVRQRPQRSNMSPGEGSGLEPERRASGGVSEGSGLEPEQRLEQLEQRLEQRLAPGRVCEDSGLEPEQRQDSGRKSEGSGLEPEQRVRMWEGSGLEPEQRQDSGRKSEGSGLEPEQRVRMWEGS